MSKKIAKRLGASRIDKIATHKCCGHALMGPHGDGCLEQRLRQEIDSLKRELEEQCRLHGMGSEREAKTLSEIEALKRELAEAKEKIKNFESDGDSCRSMREANVRLRERAEEMNIRCNKLLEESEENDNTFMMAMQRAKKAESLAARDWKYFEEIRKEAMKSHYHNADAGEECDQHCLEGNIEALVKAALSDDKP